MIEALEELRKQEPDYPFIDDLIEMEKEKLKGGDKRCY